MDIGIAECLSEASAALRGRITPELTAEAQRWYLAALAHDPRSVEALTGLALTCQQIVANPWWGDPRAAAAASDLGREAVAIALDLAPGHAVGKCIQGMLYSAAGQLELAARAFEQALGMDRALGPAHGFAGYNAALLGRADETMPAVERAMRLDPMDRRHSIWFCFGGFAELLLGRTEASIGLLHKSLERNPGYGNGTAFLDGRAVHGGAPKRSGRGGSVIPETISGLPNEHIRAALDVAVGFLRLSRSNSSIVREDLFSRRGELTAGS
jgi:tetratricopeptide (TPR) repeat protein